MSLLVGYLTVLVWVVAPIIAGALFLMWCSGSFDE